MTEDVSRIAALGESTLVLYVGGELAEGARALLPRLPEACFVPADPVTAPALAEAAAGHGLGQLVVVGTLPGLAALLPSTDALVEITMCMSGSADLAERVAGPGDAYEAWESAGVLGTHGRELCRRVADGLEPTALAVQVVLLDAAGRRMVGMYGRLAR